MAFADPPAGFDPPLREGFNYQGGRVDGIDRQFNEGAIEAGEVAESAFGRCPACHKSYDAHDGWMLFANQQLWLPVCDGLDDILLGDGSEFYP
jgi:hypothetical protein